jgi:hypothetical protein
VNYTMKAKQRNKLSRRGKSYEIVSLPGGGSILRIVRKPKSAPKILPKFWIRGSIVYCDAKKLDLTKKPMTLRLLQAFCAQSDLRLNKTHLVNHIYDGFHPATKSARFNDILAQNVTKLISRARILLSDAFDDPTSPWIDFFNFSADDDTWNLYQLNNQYLRTKELEIAKRLDFAKPDNLN